MRGCPQGPAAQHTEAKTQSDQRRVPILIDGLWHKDPHPQSPAQTWDRELGLGLGLGPRPREAEGERKPPRGEGSPDLAAPGGAVLDPLKVHGAEGGQREAGEAQVIVLIHAQGEGGVRVSVAGRPHRPQGC